MTISDNGNGVVILHRKRYDNAIEEKLQTLLNSKSSKKT